MGTPKSHQTTYNEWVIALEILMKMSKEHMHTYVYRDIPTLPLFSCRTTVPVELFGNFQGKHSKRVKMWSLLGRDDTHARGWKQASGSMARPRANLAKPDARCGVRFSRPHRLFVKEKEIYVLYTKRGENGRRATFLGYSRSAVFNLRYAYPRGYAKTS
jgi:hypothetical protein